MPDFDTQSIHGRNDPDPATGGLSVPIQMASTYKLPGFGIKLFEAVNLESEDAPHLYSRWSNPTLRALEQRLAALEGAESGLVFASGMAAITAFLLTFLQSGDHVLASEVCYPGAQEFMGIHLPRYGIQVSLVDTSDVRNVQRALQPNTRLVYLETPANPLTRITDIAAVARLAGQVGARVAVDSTFASPILQKPLALGADFVIHSLTKYINGHADALGGAILGPRDALLRIRKEMLVHLGGALSPFNAWLILRGLETLPVRMQKHCENAVQIASFLESHPAVERVYYPGLESHPHHELARNQMSAYGGMLAFRLKKGLSAAINLAEKVRLWTYATSLGHPASLLFYYPADMYVDAAAYLSDQQKFGLREWTGEGIVRASVGLEDSGQLIADLDQALRARTFKGLFGPLAYNLAKKFTPKKENA